MPQSCRRDLEELRETKLGRITHEELGGGHLRLWVACVLAAPIPSRMAGRLRSALLRLAGLRIGPGAMMAGMPAILGGPGFEQQLTIGPGCWLNVGCTLDAHPEPTLN